MATCWPENGLQAHMVWAKIHGGKRKKRVNLSLKNFWKQLATINLFKMFMPWGVNQIEECSWVENETQLLLDVCEAILFPMDDLQLAFSNVPTIFTAKHLCTEDALSWRGKVNTCGFTLNWITPRLWPPPPGLLWPAPPETLDLVMQPMPWNPITL